MTTLLAEFSESFSTSFAAFATIEPLPGHSRKLRELLGVSRAAVGLTRLFGFEAFGGQFYGLSVTVSRQPRRNPISINLLVSLPPDEMLKEWSDEYILEGAGDLARIGLILDEASEYITDSEWSAFISFKLPSNEFETAIKLPLINLAFPGGPGISITGISARIQSEDQSFNIVMNATDDLHLDASVSFDRKDRLNSGIVGRLVQAGRKSLELMAVRIPIGGDTDG